MTSPYDPYGKIYTILPEEWASFLVLGWTTGRRGYVSIAMITPNIPSEANPDHYVRIRSPRRRVNTNEIAVTLRKNKRFSALVENSYVRLDAVWEVPFAIMSEVPRTGMQLMVRAVSMEMIMEIYSTWGWDQAWGRTYQSCPGYLQWSGYCQNQNDLRPPESIKQNGEAEHPQMTRQPTQTLKGLAPSGTLEQDGNPEDEALAGSESIGSWDPAYRPDEEGDGCSEEGASPCTRQDMFYGDAHHCAAHVSARFLIRHYVSPAVSSPSNLTTETSFTDVREGIWPPIVTAMNGTVYTMEITQNPECKLYTIDRRIAKTYKIPIPAGYNGHMVLVLGRVPSQRGLVKIVTITSSVDPNVDWRDYLPIYPSKKNQKPGIQLRLRNSADCWMEVDQRSYARVDSECTAPLQILKKTPEEGLQFELKSESRQLIQHNLNGRPTQAALGQPRPYVQTQTEMEEAQIEVGLSGDAAV